MHVLQHIYTLFTHTHSHISLPKLTITRILAIFIILGIKLFFTFLNIQDVFVTKLKIILGKTELIIFDLSSFLQLSIQNLKKCQFIVSIFQFLFIYFFQFQHSVRNFLSKFSKYPSFYFFRKKERKKKL